RSMLDNCQPLCFSVSTRGYAWFWTSDPGPRQIHLQQHAMVVPVHQPRSIMKTQVIAIALSLLAIAPALPAAAQSVGPEIVPDFFAASAQPAPPPLRLAESLAPRPETSLQSAEVGARDALEALRAWNRAGHLPLRAGLVRPLPAGVKAHLAAAVTQGSPIAQGSGLLGVSPAGSRVWGTRVDVDGAQRLRL